MMINPKSDFLYRPVFFVSFGLTYLAFGLPVYSKSLGATAVSIGGLYSVFTLTTVLLRPFVGMALDRNGRKPFFIAGLLIYALAMGLFAFATSLVGFYLARIVQGVASAVLWTAVNTVVADVARPDERGHVTGRITENSSRGQMLGMFLAFSLFNLVPAEQVWTGAFLLFAGTAVWATYLAWKTAPETLLKEEGVLRGRGNTDRKTRKVRVPPIRVKIPKQLLNLLGVVFTTGFSTAMLAPIYLIFLQDRFTVDVMTLAWAFFPAGIVSALLAARLGKLSDRWGRVRLMALGLAGAGILSLLLPTLPSLYWLVGLYTLTAVARAISNPAEAAMVADLTNREQHGRAYGLYTFAGSLGALVGPLLGGWLYDGVGTAVPFYLNGVVLLISAGWVMLTLSDKPTSNRVKYS